MGHKGYKYVYGMQNQMVSGYPKIRQMIVKKAYMYSI